MRRCRRQPQRFSLGFPHKVLWKAVKQLGTDQSASSRVETPSTSREYHAAPPNPPLHLLLPLASCPRTAENKNRSTKAKAGSAVQITSVSHSLISAIFAPSCSERRTPFDSPSALLSPTDCQSQGYISSQTSKANHAASCLLPYVLAHPKSEHSSRGKSARTEKTKHRERIAYP